MGLTVVRLPHPISAEGLTVEEDVAAGATAAELGLRDGWIGVADGAELAPGDAPRDSAIVVLRRAVAGGDDSDPLRTVLQIALVVAAVYVTGGTWAAGAAQWKVAAAVTAVTVGGNLVINAIAPPTLPGLDAASASLPEPIYSLTGGANRVRVHQPLLLVLGTHRVFPDLAAREYTEFASRAAGATIANTARRRPAGVGGARWAEIQDLSEFDATDAVGTSVAPSATDQFLYQIFHFGLGDLDIPEADIKIGDTALSALSDVQTQWSDAAGALTLVRGNVDTTAGAELSTAWTQLATPANTARIALDFIGQIFAITAQGELRSHAVSLNVECWPDGDEASKRAWTLRLPHATSEPYRVSLPYELDAPGVWQVRVKRAAAASSDDRIRDDVSWAALRSYSTDAASYLGQRRLALRIRASGQLSGRVDRLSALVSQLVPVWEIPDGGTKAAWSDPKPTSNPAWIYRWLALGVRIGNDVVAGVGLAAERVDDASIQAWGAWCDAEGLACNYVLDRAVSHWDLLSLVAACGRAAISWESGKLGVVWDAANRPATAWIGPQNVHQGSFEVDWTSGAVADEIVCNFVDPDSDWQRIDVRRSVPGVVGAGRTATLDLPGVTSRDQAAKACNLQAARQKYHRRRMRWRMGPEGLALSRGAVVSVHGGLVDGGVTGRLVACEIVADNCLVRLDRPIDGVPEIAPGRSIQK